MTNVLSDVAIAYNQHLANLDEARQQFESDVTELNAIVAERLVDSVGAPIERLRKHRWRDLVDFSSQRASSWLAWSAATKVRLDLRSPDRANFKNGAAELYFEFKYDRDAERFRFSVRFENRNTVNERLDEVLAGYIGLHEDAYPEGSHIKSNTTILLRADLSTDIHLILAGHVDASLEAVRAMVDQVLPDDAYEQKSHELDEVDDVASEPDDELD